MDAGFECECGMGVAQVVEAEAREVRGADVAVERLCDGAGTEGAPVVSGKHKVEFVDRRRRVLISLGSVFAQEGNCGCVERNQRRPRSVFGVEKCMLSADPTSV